MTPPDESRSTDPEHPPASGDEPSPPGTAPARKPPSPPGSAAQPVPPSVHLTHVFTFFNRLGGVEAMLRRHLAQDRSQGIRSSILAIFDRDDPVDGRVRALGCSGLSTPHAIRHAFKCRHEDLPQPGVLAYHNAWGVPFLADLDSAVRRVAVFHSEWPGFEDGLDTAVPFLDGILCAGTGVEARVREHLPSFPQSRIRLLPYAIDPPAADLQARPWPPHPLVIGYCGRVVRAQKRVDRLPELCRALAARRIDYRLEILGDGPGLSWLKRRLPAEGHCRFHGRKSGAEYWGILAGWDAVVFVSDYEGLPIAMLEAMYQGASPIYPAIHSGGDSYARAVAPPLLYPAGSIQGAADACHWLAQQTGAGATSLRIRARQLAGPHAGNIYERTFSEFVHEMLAMPPLAATPPVVRPTPGWRIPLAMLSRLPIGRFPRRGVV